MYLAMGTPSWQVAVQSQWFGYVVDTVYSQSMDLIGAMGKHPGLICFSGSGGHPWLKAPKTEERQMSVMVAAIKTESVTVARTMPVTGTTPSGTGGPFERAPKVPSCTSSPRDGLPCTGTVFQRRPSRLIVKRTDGPKPFYSYNISDAPLRTRLPAFVCLSGVRWTVEQCFAIVFSTKCSFWRKI